LNFRRILTLAAAIAAVAAAAAVCVVAASYAVYALAEAHLGPAGGAAVVAGVFALLALVVALAATRKAIPKSAGAGQADASLADRVIGLAKDRPLIAVAAAAAIGVVLFRNPAAVGAIVSAFVNGSPPKPPK